MPEEYDYYINKRPDRIYISRAFSGSAYSFEEGRKLRIISKVFDEDELYEFATIKKELVLRVTPAKREEVKAVFYEDSRKIQRLTIQRFSRKTGKPYKRTHFTFSSESLDKLYRLLRIIKVVDLEDDEKIRLDDEILDDILVSDKEKRRFIRENIDLVEEIVRNDITKSDVIALAYRKKQLELFKRLLHDEHVFEEYKKRWRKKGDEAVWQHFFEQNSWIFGYGLSYIFTSQLNDRKLEQVTSGYTFAQSGKRVDALLKTRGLISSLCFVEIKTHRTPLLITNKKAYRPESWSISDELAGSIAQIQKTVQKAVKGIATKTDLYTHSGDPTGESVFLYQPKSIVVIGSLEQFITRNGVNEQKFSSFELFRRNVVNPEIITFDELYERAKFIVQHSDSSNTAIYDEPVETPYPEIDENDLPF